MGGYILLGTKNKSEKQYIDLPMIQEPNFDYKVEIPVDPQPESGS